MTKEPSLKFRLTVFPILAIIFSIAAYFIVMLALGYQFKYENGKLIKEKTGSIILASRPGDAQVFIDDKLYRKKTSPFSLFSLNIDKLSVGNHKVKIVKDGFETWEGSIEVESGMVSWVNKLLLVNLQKESSPYNFSGNVVQVLSSPNKSRVLIVVENPEKKIREFWEINANTKEKRKILAPTDLSFKINFLTYSEDNERVLAVKTVGETKQHVIYNLQENGQAWDLTSLFAININQIIFNPRASGEVYLVRENNLYNLNYEEKRLSAVLEKNLIEIYNQNNQIYFIQNLDGNYGLWRWEQNGNKTNIIKALPVSESYQFATLPELSSYLVLPNKDKSLLLYINRKGTPALEKVGENVDWFTPSPESKYVSYSKEGSIYSYEIDKNRYFTTLKDRKISYLTWFMDEFNQLFFEEGKLKMVTVNGFYNKTLFEAIDSPILVSPNNTNIYFGAKNNNQNDVSTYSFNY